MDNRYVPNYENQCENCGQGPTVDVINSETNKLEHRFDLCGPCCFGTAAALDPNEWN